jgi:hypothetical protein
MLVADDFEIFRIMKYAEDYKLLKFNTDTVQKETR